MTKRKYTAKQRLDWVIKYQPRIEANLRVEGETLHTRYRMAFTYQERERYCWESSVEDCLNTGIRFIETEEGK